MSFVSKRWRYLCTQVSSFNFDEFDILCSIIKKNKCPVCHDVSSPNSTSCGNHKVQTARKLLEDSLDRVLLLHSDGTIDKLRLSFNYVTEATQGRKLDTWLRLAFTSNIKEIHLGFYSRMLATYFAVHGLVDRIPSRMYEIPMHKFSPKFLKKLTLSCCKFKSSGFKSFQSLQKLVLLNVFIIDPSVTILASRCPAIEDLHMEDCSFSHDFLVSDEELLVKGLHLERCSTLNTGNIQMDISTPHLERLVMVGCVVTKSHVHKATKLVSAQIDMVPSFEMTEQEIRRAFAGLQTCQELRLTSQMIKALPTWQTMMLQPIILFPHLIHLTLESNLGKHEFSRILDLLGRCQRLELLNIDVQRALSSSAEVIPEFDDDNSWRSQDSRYSGLQKQLKKVTVTGFTGTKYEKNLIHFLLTNAEVLERMSITYIVRNNSQRLLTEDAVTEVMLIRRASRTAQIWISPDPLCGNIDGLFSLST